MAVLYVIVVLGGPYAEAYCIANDFEQAQGRVFQAIVRITAATRWRSIPAAAALARPRRRGAGPGPALVRHRTGSAARSIIRQGR